MGKKIVRCAVGAGSGCARLALAEREAGGGVAGHPDPSLRGDPGYRRADEPRVFCFPEATLRF